MLVVWLMAVFGVEAVVLCETVLEFVVNGGSKGCGIVLSELDKLYVDDYIPEMIGSRMSPCCDKTKEIALGRNVWPRTSGATAHTGGSKPSGHYWNWGDLLTYSSLV